MQASRSNAAFALLAPLLVPAAFAMGCSESKPDAAAVKVSRGAELYGELCVTCHGKSGEGVSGPSLRDWSRGEEALVGVIDERMPLGDPSRCDRACAESIGAYVLATFKGPLVCEPSKVVSKRGLRLLTRREYKNTVADLLYSSKAAPNEVCGVHTFAFDAKGKKLTSVHVAGSFNGWPAKVSLGGFPMKLDAAKGVWSVAQKITPGNYAYKFVLDEAEWVTDPSNPNKVSDGYGGENSLLALASSCSGGAARLPFDPTSGFPAESRPEGFAFDDHGPSRVVTSVHASEYLAAAKALAKTATEAPALDALVACDYRANAPACVESFVRGFGKRAFRRPLTDAEATRVITLAKKQPSFASSIEVALRALLTSPSFLYRSEMGVAEGGVYKLAPHEVASALSYMFWGTMPDDALLEAADRGDLASPSGVEAQARRLLADPRSRDAIALFAEQWLGAENALSVNKSDALFPGFSKDLRGSMLEETRRFVTHVVFDGTHKFDELLTANYTFVDEGLAKHYGMQGVTGTAFQKKEYPDASRAGVLGHASLLATTAHSDQTSPIRRGLLVRRSLLCQEFGPPPPNAGGVPKVDPAATTRERFAQHTQNASCKSCHQYIDDVGFGFERFDPIGRMRDAENGKPIDALGDMNDVERFGAGTHAKFASMGELGKTLAQSASAPTCFVRQYFRFARGYHESSDDLCAVTTLAKKFAESNYDIRELMIAVALSPDFRVRQ